MSTWIRGAIWKRSSIGAFGLLLMTLLSLTPMPAAKAVEPERVPLWSWYSDSRQDFFSTSNPAWTDSTTMHAPDYVFVRVEGYVFNPRLPHPLNTRPLWGWYSAERGDNFISSDPTWASNTPGERRGGYQFVRLEGHVYDRPYAGTMEFESFWNPSAQDNRTTSDPRITSRSEIAGYRSFRVEGYLSRGENAAAPLVAADFGYNQVPIEGTRRLLVILVTYSDARTFRTNHDAAFYDQLVFGQPPSGGDVVGYTREMSAGHFTWARTKYSVVGPVSLSRRSSDSLAKRRASALRAAASQGGVSFSDFDRDGNGRISPTELTVLMIDPPPPGTTGSWGPGQTAGTDPSCVSAGGADVCLAFPSVGEDAKLSIITHELLHTLNDDDKGMTDIYGIAIRNYYDSLAAAEWDSGYPQNWVDPYHVDPWHKMRWGWVEPRLLPLTGAPSCRWLIHQQRAALREPDSRPILLYDPARIDFNREYLLLEHRNALAGGYDRMAGFAGFAAGGKPFVEQGLAVWWFKSGSDGRPEAIQVIEGGSDGLASRPAGDDVTYGSTILPGMDRILQSTPSGNDKQGEDRNLLLLGKPAAARGGQDDARDYWGDGNGEFGLALREGNWLSTLTGVTLRVGSVNASVASMALQWRNTGSPYRPRLDRLGGAALRIGRSFDILGEIGAGASGFRVFLRGVGGETYEAGIHSVSCDRLIGAPLGGIVPPGQYNLYVTYNNAASNELKVTVE
jgi:M6 family metalloprotease-like protein